MKKTFDHIKSWDQSVWVCTCMSACIAAVRDLFFEAGQQLLFYDTTHTTANTPN